MSTANTTSRSRRRSGLIVPWLLLGLVLWPGLAAGTAGGGGSLLITGEEPGRPVWVGQRYAGVVPVVMDSLEEGEMIVSVGAFPDQREWVRPWTMQVVLASSARQSLQVPILQTLRLRSRPEPCFARLDGRDVGETPLSLLVPARGEVRLDLCASPRDSLVLVYQGNGARDSTLVMDLGRFRDLPGTRDAILVSRAGGWSIARWILPAGAILSGVTGVWARHEAESAYSTYRRSLDRDRMARELDRARKFDRVAAGCWIAADAGLLASAWILLRVERGAALSVSAGSQGEVRLGLCCGYGGHSDSGPAASQDGVTPHPDRVTGVSQ
jgi:hypothetical protein